MPEKERFSIVKRAESFTFAFRGLRLFMRSTPNASIQLVMLAFAIGLGLYFRIAPFEWMFLALASGMVLAAEAFNTAFEIDINLTSPEYHPYAKDTKDVAAGAVLISAVTALVIGGFIFIPRILSAWF